MSSLSNYVFEYGPDLYPFINVIVKQTKLNQKFYYLGKWEAGMIMGDTLPASTDIELVEPDNIKDFLGSVIIRLTNNHDKLNQTLIIDYSLLDSTAKAMIDELSAICLAKGVQLVVLDWDSKKVNDVVKKNSVVVGQ